MPQATAELTKFDFELAHGLRDQFHPYTLELDICALNLECGRYEGGHCEKSSLENGRGQGRVSDV